MVVNIEGILKQFSLGGVDPLAALLAVVAILLGIRSIALQRRIARAQRVFESAQLKIELLGDDSAPSPFNFKKWNYYFLIPFTRDRLAVCYAPLSIRITNTGKKSAEALEVYIEIPPGLNFPVKALEAEM